MNFTSDQADFRIITFLEITLNLINSLVSIQNAFTKEAITPNLHENIRLLI